MMGMMGMLMIPMIHMLGIMPRPARKTCGFCLGCGTNNTYGCPNCGGNMHYVTDEAKRIANERYGVVGNRLVTSQGEKDA